MLRFFFKGREETRSLARPHLWGADWQITSSEHLGQLTGPKKGKILARKLNGWGLRPQTASRLPHLAVVQNFAFFWSGVHQ